MDVNHWFEAFQQALWFFLPISVANQMPGFVSALKLWNPPINTHLLGANKTWAAYPAGILGALAVSETQRHWGHLVLIEPMVSYEHPYYSLIVAGLGLGAILGDHLESFVKRRLGLPSGTAFVPFDQTDYIVGALVAYQIMLGRLPNRVDIALFAIALVVHIPGNAVAYYLNLRKKIM